MNRSRPLAQNFHAYGALAGYHVRVIVGVHECELAHFFQLERAGIGLVVGIAVQYHFSTTRRHRLHFDLRRGGRHDDDCFAAELLRGKCHTLRVIAC